MRHKQDSFSNTINYYLPESEIQPVKNNLNNQKIVEELNDSDNPSMVL